MDSLPLTTLGGGSMSACWFTCLCLFVCNHIHNVKLFISVCAVSHPRVYNAKAHPKVISGEKTEDEIFKEFLTTFDTPDSPDGVVS